ncbi:MAG: hypothetical protein ACTS8Z_07770 [Candidatus Limnocylindrales bacterium]
MADPGGSAPASGGPTPAPGAAHQPGAAEVLLVAIAVVAVVVAASVVTGILPTSIQQAIFRGPVLIAFLIVGTGWLLWRISRGRPHDGDR